MNNITTSGEISINPLKAQLTTDTQSQRFWNLYVRIKAGLLESNALVSRNPGPNPVWDKPLTVMTDPDSEFIDVNIYNANYNSDYDFIGRAQVPLRNITTGSGNGSGWFDVKNNRNERLGRVMVGWSNRGARGRPGGYADPRQSYLTNNQSQVGGFVPSPRVNNSMYSSNPNPYQNPAGSFYNYRSGVPERNYSSARNVPTGGGNKIGRLGIKPVEVDIGERSPSRRSPFVTFELGNQINGTFVDFDGRSLSNESPLLWLNIHDLYQNIQVSLKSSDSQFAKTYANGLINTSELMNLGSGSRRFVLDNGMSVLIDWEYQGQRQPVQNVTQNNGLPDKVYTNHPKYTRPNPNTSRRVGSPRVGSSSVGYLNPDDEARAFKAQYLHGQGGGYSYRNDGRPRAEKGLNRMKTDWDHVKGDSGWFC